MVNAPNQVYGLCNVPIKVLGYIDTEIQLSEHPSLVQRIQVLDSEDPIVILGRSLMCKFKEVVFDFEHGRIKLGKNWENVDVSASSSTPISRAALASEMLYTKKMELHGHGRSHQNSLGGPDIFMGGGNYSNKISNLFIH